MKTKVILSTHDQSGSPITVDWPKNVPIPQIGDKVRCMGLSTTTVKHKEFVLDQNLIIIHAY